MCGRPHAWLTAIALWRKARTPPRESRPSSNAEPRSQPRAESPEPVRANNEHRLDEECKENFEEQSDELPCKPVMQELDLPLTGIRFEIDDCTLDYSDDDLVCGILF